MASTLTSSHEFLLDCLIPTTFLASAAEAADRLFVTLEGTFGRIARNPESEKFRRINSESATWTARVAPYTYPARLAAWGGFCAVEGIDEDAAGHVLINTLSAADAEMKRWEACLLRNHWARTITASTDASANAAASQSFFCEEARCQQLLRELAAAVPPGDVSEWNRVRRCVYLGRLRAAATTSAPDALANNTDDLSRRAKSALLTALNAALKAPTVDSSPQQAAAAAAAAAVAVAASSEIAAVCAFFHAGESVPFTVLAESLALAEAERNSGSSRGVSSPVAADHQTPIATATASSSLLEERRARHEALASRHRKQRQRESARAYQESTGEAYRRLSAEEQSVGVSLVLDIASRMEQVEILSDGDNTSLVNKPRIAAKELLGIFKQSGDLLALHDLADEWEARLDEAKRKAGKIAVYL